MIRLHRAVRIAAALIVAVSMTAGASLARAECAAVNPATQVSAAPTGHEGMNHDSPSTPAHQHDSDGDHHSMPDGMRDCALALGCSLAGVSTPRAAPGPERPSTDAFGAVYQTLADVDRAPDTPPPRA